MAMGTRKHRQRVLRGDREVVPYVVEAASQEVHWFFVVPQIWCTELKRVVDAALSKLAGGPAANRDVWDNTHHFLADLLRDIPPTESWALLAKHWRGLCSKVPLFVQVALYLSTPESRTYAAEAITHIGPDAESLRDVDTLFRFMDSRHAHRLTVGHLESLQPFITQLPDSCLSSMIQFCGRHNHWPWAVEYLQPEVERRTVNASPRHGSGASPVLRMKNAFLRVILISSQNSTKSNCKTASPYQTYGLAGAVQPMWRLNQPPLFRSQGVDCAVAIVRALPHLRYSRSNPWDSLPPLSS